MPKGRFERQTSHFRNWVTRDGAPGPSGIGGFAGERARYHLYVSLAGPWAHRTLILRRLKGLANICGVLPVRRPCRALSLLRPPEGPIGLIMVKGVGTFQP